MNHAIRNFVLRNGAVFPEAAVAYDTWGKLAPDGRNAVLVTHGFTSDHHAAGAAYSSDDTAGWWDALIGPGKAIDTGRFFVVSSNSVRFDAEKDFGRIKAKLLYVLSSTDRLFPPSLAPEVMASLKAAGVDAEYFQLESDYDHLAAGRDAAKWAPVLKRFMEGLPRS